MHFSAKSYKAADTPLFHIPYQAQLGLRATLCTCPRKPRMCTNATPSSKFGSPGPKKPYGYWKRLSNVLTELEEYMASKNPRPTSMPTAHELSEAGRQDLAGAIRRHTWRKVAEAVNLPLSSFTRPRSLNLSFCTEIHTKRMRPYMYWRDFENVERELREFIHERGEQPGAERGKNEIHMPTAAELVDNGRSDLKRAILLHGGARKVAKRMGLSPKSRPIEFWNEESIVEEISRVVERTGRKNDFPTLQDMRQYGERGLISAIRRFGGSRAFAKQMGLSLRRRGQKR